MHLKSSAIFFVWDKTPIKPPHRSLNIRPTEIPWKHCVFSWGHRNQARTSCDVQTIGDFFFLSFFFILLYLPSKEVDDSSGERQCWARSCRRVESSSSTPHPNSCQSASRSPPVPRLMENSNACCLLGCFVCDDTSVCEGDYWVRDLRGGVVCGANLKGLDQPWGLVPYIYFNGTSPTHFTRHLISHVQMGLPYISS